MGTFRERVLLMVFVSALLMGVEGCTTHLADIPMLSTKHVDLSGVKLGNRHKGEDCIVFLLVPKREPDIRVAMDRAIEKGKGDMLIDLVVDRVIWSAVLVSQFCYVVEGTVARTVLYKP